MAAGLDPSPNTQGNHAWIADTTKHLPAGTLTGDTQGLVALGLKTGVLGTDANTTTTVLTASGTFIGIDAIAMAGLPGSGMTVADQLARQWPLGV